jgi:lipocalin
MREAGYAIQQSEGSRHLKRREFFSICVDRKRSKTMFSLYAFLVFLLAEVASYAPITELDTPAYLGRWYQTYASFNFVLLELGGNCATADYELVRNDTVALVNTARVPPIPTAFTRTTGFAVQSPTTPGFFNVYQCYDVPVVGSLLECVGLINRPTDPDEVTFVGLEAATYWIFAIGPIVNGQYQWAAVSNADKSLSFIIARNVTDFEAKHEVAVLKIFEDNGFDNRFTNKPVKTNHVGCTYD